MVDEFLPEHELSAGVRVGKELLYAVAEPAEGGVAPRRPQHDEPEEKL